MKRDSYSIIDHTADIGFEVRADDKSSLFSKSAYAMTDLMVDSESISATKEIRVSVYDSFDMESLFIAWLSEILFHFETKRFLLSEVKSLCFQNNVLYAVLSGERYNESKHSVKMTFKAPTYHRLKVGREGSEWVAKVIMDV